MKKRIIWFVIIAAAAMLIFHFATMALLNFGIGQAGQFSQHGQSFGLHGMQKGGFGHFGDSSRHMMGGHHSFTGTRDFGGMSSFVFPLLFELGLIGAGFVIWKLSAKNKVLKWSGAGLVFIGLWALLPNWLVLLALIVGVYYWYKTRNAEDRPIVTGDYLTVPTQKLDFLDEWERTIMKEEK